MLFNKEFTGLVLDGETIKVAHVKKDGNKLELIKLESFSLIENIGREDSEKTSFYKTSDSPEGGDEQADASPGDVFGFENTVEDDASQSEGSTQDDINFEELEAQAQLEEPESLELDMVDEAEGPQSNALLLYNILSGINNKTINLGLNISAGETIFQIIDDTDFNEVKTKDLIEDLEAKLESIYGAPKSPDNYAYDIREDGSLVLASVEDEARSLALINEAKEFYNGKLRIKTVYPDEVALANLVQANYSLQSSEITAVLQFGLHTCRIIFMSGEDIMLVPAMVNQGTSSSNFLNTVFSKILFQLDTGKVPSLDQIVIANNTLGEDAVAFFKQNFPSITVQNLEYNQEKLDTGDTAPSQVNAYTTAIAAAWAASGLDKKDEEPKLSFLPGYVEERQKIFKLQWHGIMLLVLIFMSPIIINYFYQQNATKIDGLSSELDLTNGRINQITPIVNNTNQISQDLTLLTNKLALLDSLSEGSKAWSAKLNMIDKGMSRIPNSWYTSLSKTQDGTFIEGYTLFRNRIPAIVDIFAEATLLNVSIETIRDKELFRFSMIVNKFAKDSTVYSPEKPQSIEQILNN